MSRLRLFSATLWMMSLAMLVPGIPLEDLITPTWRRYNEWALQRRRNRPDYADRVAEVAADEARLLRDQLDLIRRSAVG